MYVSNYTAAGDDTRIAKSLTSLVFDFLPRPVGRNLPSELGLKMRPGVRRRNSSKLGSVAVSDCLTALRDIKPHPFPGRLHTAGGTPSAAGLVSPVNATRGTDVSDIPRARQNEGRTRNPQTWRGKTGREWSYKPHVNPVGGSGWVLMPRLLQRIRIYFMISRTPRLRRDSGLSTVVTRRR